MMSGTSLDGVDGAWVETDGITVASTGVAVTLRYQESLRADLRHLLEIAPGLKADSNFLRDVEHRLTQDHCIVAAMIGQGCDVIGMHGQTILHDPQHRRTWQIGDAGPDCQKIQPAGGARLSLSRRRGGRAGRPSGAALPRSAGACLAQTPGDCEYWWRRQHHLSWPIRANPQLRYRPGQRPDR